jgi:hypothetical protein
MFFLKMMIFHTIPRKLKNTTQRTLRIVCLGTKKMEGLPGVKHQRYLEKDLLQGDILLQFPIYLTDRFEL